MFQNLWAQSVRAGCGGQLPRGGKRRECRGGGHAGVPPALPNRTCCAASCCSSPACPPPARHAQGCRCHRLRCRRLRPEALDALATRGAAAPPGNAPVQHVVLVEVRHRLGHLHKYGRRLLLAILQAQLVQPVDDLAAPEGSSTRRGRGRGDFGDGLAHGRSGFAPPTHNPPSPPKAALEEPPAGRRLTVRPAPGSAAQACLLVGPRHAAAAAAPPPASARAPQSAVASAGPTHRSHSRTRTS